MYYFSEEKQQLLIDEIWKRTATNGFLVTSSTEPLRNMGERWDTVFPSVYRKK